MRAELRAANLHQVLVGAEDRRHIFKSIGPSLQISHIFVEEWVVIGKLAEVHKFASARLNRVTKAGRVSNPAEG